MYGEVISRYTECLGESHVDTLMAKVNLATLLQLLGENDKARVLYNVVIAGLTESLGGSHVDTLLAKENLANLLFELRVYGEAKDLYSTCAERYADIYGAEHEETVLTIASLRKCDTWIQMTEGERERHHDRRCLQKTSGNTNTELVCSKCERPLYGETILSCKLCECDHRFETIC